MQKQTQADNIKTHLWIAKSRPSAATVFSPPESCSMSRKRFIGGMALNFTPPRYGSSGLSRLRKAFPPRGCLLLRVRSCSRGKTGEETMGHGQ